MSAHQSENGPERRGLGPDARGADGASIGTVPSTIDAMAIILLTTPIVLDAIVSIEKLVELLSYQTEYPELDFKRSIDLASKDGFLEFTKDIGAMEVRGGYIVVGVDGSGAPTDDMKDCDPADFDEAKLVPRLRKYLPDPIELRVGVHELEGNTVVLIYVGRHPHGYAIFHTDGQYEKNGKPVIKFRVGEAFWRDGTRSVRITQQGMEEIFARRLTEAKVAWLEDHQQMLRQGQAEIEAAYASRQRADAPLGAVSLDLSVGELTLAALELVRANDRIAIRHILNDAVARAREVIERDEIETELADVLDKLTCLAAMFLQYEEREWFASVITTFLQIHALPVDEFSDRRFSLSTGIGSNEKGPRVWLLELTRIYALGALAVRLGDWEAVRNITLQRPDKMDEYWKSWLRHDHVMLGRAHHLKEEQEGREVAISLLSLARAEISRLHCLRADGTAAEDEAILTSLAQFDFLSNLVAIDGAGEAASSIFWPSFSRFRQDRIQPAADRLLVDQEMRSQVFGRGDDDLAIALASIGKVAMNDGFRYDGFNGWEHTKVGEFVEQNLPQ
jgi:hypothetical protein